MFVLGTVCRAIRYTPNLEKLATWYGLHGFDMIIDGKRVKLGCL